MELVSAISSRVREVPEWIVFIPEGRHWIHPQSHRGGTVVHMPAERGEKIAATFNAALARHRVGAWIDFEHTRKAPASGYPKEFRYEAGRGLLARIEWSSAGRRALEGGDVGYFSAEFYKDREGVPMGLPESGPIGGLVTEPAFGEIGRIAAGARLGEEELTPYERLAAAFADMAPDEPPPPAIPWDEYSSPEERLAASISYLMGER